MPLTPRFELSQTEDEVLITIFVPTIRVGNIEVLVENDNPQQNSESDDDDDDVITTTRATTTTTKTTTSSTFHFHAAPYFLKLRFAPYQFSEAVGADSVGNIPASYDPSTQQIVVRLAKAEPGKFWTHLDMMARLVQPKEIPKQWLHAVTPDEKRGTDRAIHDEDEAIFVEDTAPTGTSSDHHHHYFGYGFGGIFQNIFTDYCRGGLAQEMLQLPSNPETTAPLDRRRMRQEREMKDFDEERYLGDSSISTDDYMYPMVVEYVPFWRAEKSTFNSLSNQMEHMTINDVWTSSMTSFTSDEKLQLASIPYPLIPKAILDFSESSTFWPGLLDLLIPFVYDHLTTMGDPTVESAWTITTLSCSLSWLDPPSLPPPSSSASSSTTTTTSGVYDAVVQVTRRMLIYPYWRNFDFCHLVLQETLSLVTTGGIHAVVKALLKLRTILEKSESYYVGNKIFVDPFLYGIQQAAMIPASVMESLKQVMLNDDALSILKSALHLDLDRIEQRQTLQLCETENDDDNEGPSTTSSDSESCCTDRDDDSDDDSRDASSSSDCSDRVSNTSTSRELLGDVVDTKKDATGTSSSPPPAIDENKLVLLDSIVGMGENSILSVINSAAGHGTEEPTTSDGNERQHIDDPRTPHLEGTRAKLLIQEIS